jgi:serine/threonine-protein kinase
VLPLPQAEAQVFGRYALYDEIAAGGMATVHIGRLLGPVGFARTVAIKRLHAQFAKDPDFVSMFLDEARLAARIRHPNVIGILDVVALQGELFLVMEYVPGESLARLWRATHERGQTIPLPIVSAALVGVLDGLHAAHEATDDHGEPLGIVHRDVSPHNILVGADGIARVLDFGVAKATGRIQSTHNGQLKGKISYMAPEQVQGTVDRRSDVYSASVVLWEALTGKRLFFAETQAKTLANVLYPRVDPPSFHVRSIPPELDAVVLQGLDPNPAGRFANAREMGRALQRAIPPATAYDVADWVEATAGRKLAMLATKVAMIARYTPDSVPRQSTGDDLSVPVSHVTLSTGTARSAAIADANSASASYAEPPSKRKTAMVILLLLGVSAAILYFAVRFVQEAPVPFGAVPVVATMVVAPGQGEAPSAAPAPKTSQAPPPQVATKAVEATPKPDVKPEAAPVATTPQLGSEAVSTSGTAAAPRTPAGPAPHTFSASSRAPVAPHPAAAPRAAAPSPKPPPPPAPPPSAAPSPSVDLDHVFDTRK